MSTEPTVKLADYLLTRLHQLGVRSIFGVPGDFNLSLLDYVEPANLHWVGCCNELNAGYAADGYARINGLSALITTFGVGELSAINAVAGAYAEIAPVVHIVGTPSREMQLSRTRVHHTFADGEFRNFAKMYSYVTIAQANLIDPRTSPSMIDDVLIQCLLHGRPVYIQVPTDMVAMSVSASRLSTPLTVPAPISPENESKAIEAVLSQIYASLRPAIYVDGESRAFGALDEIRQLISKTQWPTWTSVFGKGLIDESLPNVHGLYAADSGSATAKEYVESADLVLCFGPHYSTTNTYQSKSNPKAEVSIEFSASMVKIESERFWDLPAKHILQKLIEALDLSKLNTQRPFPTKENLENPARNFSGLVDSEPLTQKDFYHMLSPLLRAGDILLGETGTAGYGTREIPLPPHARLFNPVTWLSIGYMLPAALGAALAQRELTTQGKWHGIRQARTILVIGEGSVQMTVQEISTIIREKLDMAIIVINNAGYTIERCLHGRLQHYNDLAQWQYSRLPEVFGPADRTDDYQTCSFQVKNWGELRSALKDERMQKGKGLLLAEVFMDAMDAPAPLLPYMQKQIDAEREQAAKK
jgi:pyruvate decarboxylase